MLNFSPTFYEAIKWLNLGISPLPILPKSKKPAVYWKRYQNELPKISDLTRWFKQPFNLGVIAGWQDLTILDFDNPSAYCKFVYDYPEYRNSYTVSTSRGKHIYVYCSGARTRMTSGLDIKANGYVLAPPSLHPSGSEYRVFNDAPIIKVESIPGCSPSTLSVPVTPVRLLTPTVLGEQTLIAKIKSSYPIAAIFPPVKMTGPGLAFAHCPTEAHPNGDRDPSLSLDLINNRCQCISRSECPLQTRYGNDVIDAYMIAHGVSLKQALAMMADEIGI